MSGTLSIKDDNLVFELHGIDELFAITRSISIPLEHVVSASTEKVSWGGWNQLRTSGAVLPGVIKDGTYLTSDGTMFFEMHHPDKCVTVVLDHEKYKRIIFEVEDKDIAAQEINDAIISRKVGLDLSGLAKIFFLISRRAMKKN